MGRFGGESRRLCYPVADDWIGIQFQLRKGSPMREESTGGTLPVAALGLLLALLLPAEVTAGPRFAVHLKDGTVRYAHAPATCAFGKCVWNDVAAGRPVTVPADLVDLSRTPTGTVGNPVRQGSFTLASAAWEGSPSEYSPESVVLHQVRVQEPALLHVQHVYQVEPVYVPVEAEQPRRWAYGRGGLRLLMARNKAKRDVRGAEMAVLTASVSVARTERLVPYLKAADRRNRAEYRLAVARAELERAEEAWERGRGR